MDTSVTFPAQLDDFLNWVKTTTELAWTNAAPDDVMYQAKWLPLTDLEIVALEHKHHIKFDYEHKLFLKILHTIDKDYNYVAPEDADIPVMERVPAFYNWLKDSDEIDRMIDWPYDTISDSVPGTRGAWLKSWGTQPATDAEKLAVCASWYKKAPQLLPVFNHSFLMADAGTGLKPLLSVYGLDTIVVAWSLRHFLTRTFAEELDLEDRYFDEEDQCYYTRMKRGIRELDEWEYIRLSQANIPVWKEVITYYTSANPWEGFFF